MLIAGNAMAQSWEDGINYQGHLSLSGANVSNEAINVQFTFTDAGSSVVWQEIVADSTNEFGMFDLQIGSGTSTGAGSASDFNSIDFVVEQYTMSVQIEVDGGGYMQFSEGLLYSMPYALHSKTNEEVKALNQDLMDVNTTGLSVSQVVYWNGSEWQVATAASSLNADHANNTNQAAHADSVAYAHVVSYETSDTAQYSFLIDSANYVGTAMNAANADSVLYADTAITAYVDSDFHLDGDSIVSGEFLGSTNSEPIMIRTNGTNRLEISENGNFYAGVTDSIPSIYLTGDDGFKATGTLGSGTFTNISSGTHLYYTPKLNSMYMGLAYDTLWHESNSDENNLIFGRHSWISGHESAVFGDSCYVVPIDSSSLGRGEGSLAVGRRCRASGSWSFAVGYETVSLTQRSFAMGYQCSTPHGYACLALGYKSVGDGDLSPAVAIGKEVVADGKNSFGLGNKVGFNKRRGTFIYADYSTTDSLVSSGGVHNRWIVRAAGGTRFYSDTNLTVGVDLAAGAGAWTTISDFRKKENFKPVNGEELVKKLNNLKVNGWNYKTQSDNIIHIGPMAQEFYATFGYGESDTTITTIDPDGLIMAGVKELNKDFNQQNEVREDVKASSEMDFQDAENRISELERLIQQIRED